MEREKIERKIYTYINREKGRERGHTRREGFDPLYDRHTLTDKYGSKIEARRRREKKNLTSRENVSNLNSHHQDTQHRVYNHTAPR